MSYVVPESKAAKADGQFQFQLPGSKKKFTVPKLQYLPMDRSAAAAQFESGQYTLEDLRGLLSTMFDSDEAAGLALKLDREQIGGLLNAWQAESDIDLGESPASED